MLCVEVFLIALCVPLPIPQPPYARLPKGALIRYAWGRLPLTGGRHRHGEGGGRQSSGRLKPSAMSKPLGRGTLSRVIRHICLITFSHRKCKPWTAGEAPGKSPGAGKMACGGRLKPACKTAQKNKPKCKPWTAGKAPGKKPRHWKGAGMYKCIIN